jgi:hypothetical protein
MLEPSNGVIAYEEADDAPDAVSTPPEAGAGEAPTTDAATQQNATPPASGHDRVNADGEASPGRARPQIYDHHLPSDKHGNLIDNNGTIVARAGTERAYYEAARNAMRRVRDAGDELDRADAELRAYRDSATAPDKFKLAPTEAVAAMEWAALYKSNPEQAVKELLADAAARGINVPGLGIDAVAIQKMIKDSVAPFAADREAERVQMETRRAGEQEWNTLTQDFPWLVHHDAAFAGLLQKHPNMTPTQIALRVEREAGQRGIDLYNRAAPQEQRVNRAATPAQTTNGSMTPQAPMREAPVASGNTRDRIRALMKQYNFNMER